MTVQKVLSKLFSTEPRFSIYKGDILFEFKNCDVYVDNFCIKTIDDENNEQKIEFCEIKDVIIEEDVILLLLQDGGWFFEDGDEFVIRRKV